MRVELLQKEYTSFDDTVKQNCQELFLPQSLVLFVAMELQGASINKNNKNFR